MDGYRHYIRTNEQAVVIHGFSNAFEEPQEGDICINDVADRHFRLPLYTDSSQHRYKFQGGQLIERSEDELQAELDADPDRYKELRRAEYPPLGDQLDAIWKLVQPPTGSEAEAMKARIMAVKAKYPKPTE